ncbi:MAG: phosphoheptose isomerase [Omnitrophica bacterium RIFCSPLOWO2_01_FULL_45_10]|nr:MAG: phosphoheptose isomerase [Omnitrophica bacterium RIFCSPLOWO2_01_FULL_45_10]
MQNIIKESIKTKELLYKRQIESIEKAAKAIIISLKAGGKVLIFGNGGSAADSQHIVAELVGRFKKERPALPAIALSTNTSILSAIANDYGYEITFSRQLEALAKSKDVAIALSTSGNSKNVLEALKKAKALGLVTIGLTGQNGGLLKEVCDISILVPSKETARIQESHIMIGHIICELVEREMFR